MYERLRTEKIAYPVRTSGNDWKRSDRKTTFYAKVLVSVLVFHTLDPHAFSCATRTVGLRGSCEGVRGVRISITYVPLVYFHSTWRFHIYIGDFIIITIGYCTYDLLQQVRVAAASVDIGAVFLRRREAMTNGPAAASLMFFYYNIIILYYISFKENKKKKLSSSRWMAAAAAGRGMPLNNNNKKKRPLIPPGSQWRRGGRVTMKLFSPVKADRPRDVLSPSLSLSFFAHSHPLFLPVLPIIS